MKKILLIACVFVFAAVMAHAAAAESNEETGTAKAKIVAAAAISHASGDSLNFGTLVSPTASKTVTLSAAAVPEVEDEDGLVRAAGNTSADHFSLSGLETGVQYTVVIPASVQIASGANKMTVDLTPSATKITGAASGTDDLYVGGTLHIGQNQASGDYTATYPVKVTY